MKRLSTWLILAAIVVILGISLAMGRAAAPDGEFAGTDAQATEMLQGQGVKPWFSPVLDLGSAELESGLFAAQAALGGIVLGYCVGRLHGRRIASTASVDTPEVSSAPGATATPRTA